jgi:site-specific recombinase XerD
VPNGRKGEVHGRFNLAADGNAGCKVWGFPDKQWVNKWEIPPYAEAREIGSKGRKSPTASDGTFGEEWQARLETEMRSRKYSPSTHAVYVHFNRMLCKKSQKTPDEISPDDVKRFMAGMERGGHSASTMNLAYSAIKFFFRNVLGKDGIRWQRRPKQDKVLPSVLSKEEIKKILDTEGNPRNRILLMLVCSAGLRVSEAVAVKREHIDIDRRTAYVKAGKGRKDRCTILSEKAIPFLKEYCERYGIQMWLFPGQSTYKPLSIRSAQRIFENAIQKAGIAKKTSIHGLRHTFATHLLENGTDIRYIQALLGHSSVRTTERYARVALRKVLTVKSPLDKIQLASTINKVA